MKKILATIFFISICIAVCAKTQDDKFINALRTCSSYKDSGNINTEGITANSIKEISGWQDNKCIYKEAVNMNGFNINIKCGFSQQQINEIISVADAYYLTLRYSNEQIDTSSLDAVKNNPLANVFNKYVQNPEVCSISGL